MIMDDICGVYSIKNVVNGHIYIGQSARINQRFAVHRHAFRKGKHHNSHFQNAWKKYGEEYFVFKILLICDKENLTYYEQLLVDRFSPEYNICTFCVDSPLGIKHTEIARKNMSIGRIGNQNTKGHTLSDEHKAKISKTLTGRPGTTTGRKLPEYQKQKISMSLIGNTRRRGKIASPETRLKLSIAHKGQKPHNTGKHLSDETKLKLSLATKGIPKSLETRKRMSDFKRKWWAEKRKKENDNQ